MTVELLKDEPLHRGWLNVSCLTVRMPDGSTVDREVEHHRDAAAVLTYDPDRQVALMVRVFRMGPFKAGETPWLVEAAAGMIDDGETPDAAARREAWEELGVRLGPLDAVATAFSSAGISAERQFLFLAAYAPADRMAAGGGKPEERENLQPFEVPLAELYDQLEAGEIRDLKTIVLIQALRLRRPDLFALSGAVSSAA